MEFDFINQIPNSGGFTKVFFYKEVSGNSEIEEITTSGGTLDPDCLSDSDYCIQLDNYDSLQGIWKQIGPGNERLRSITSWNGDPSGNNPQLLSIAGCLEMDFSFINQSPES